MKFIGLLSISCILLSCALGEEPENKRIKRPTFIVIVAPFSGSLAEYGRSMLRGGKMRIAEFNDQNFLNGRSVKLMALDDKGDPQEASRLAENIVGYGSIFGVIGHLTTGCTLSAIPTYNAAKSVLISPVATGDELQDVQSPYAFRTILSESQQAISLADYIRQRVDTKDVVLMWEDSPLGNRLKNAFHSRSNKIGLKVEAIRVKTDSFSDLHESIDKAIKIRPGAIFFAGGAMLAALIVRKWPEKIERPLMLGTYRLISEEFMELAGKQGKGILAAHPCIWKPDFNKGAQTKGRYEKVFKYHMDWLAVQTFDAVGLLLWAVSKPGVDSTSIRNALNECRSKDSSFSGLAGPIYFDANGSLAREVNVAEYTSNGWK
ncbi:MAG TPA: branched-chain amino acid ABC transporter substrate-binding protein [Desulfatiglandales bacterium]|nr:branched-chain amino acid ABC transporter substrate-binding protein [Desulfatiglandales bacterium]